MRQDATNPDAMSLPRAVTPARRRIGCLVLTCFAVAVAAGLAWYILHGWTSAKLQRLIAAEVAPGCGRAEIEAFLDRHGIPRGYFAGMDPGGVNAYAARQAGLDEEGLSGVVQGYIPEANEHLLLLSEIFVYFFLDKQGRLAGHWVDAAVYGP